MAHLNNPGQVSWKYTTFWVYLPYSSCLTCSNIPYISFKFVLTSRSGLRNSGTIDIWDQIIVVERLSCRFLNVQQHPQPLLIRCSNNSLHAPSLPALLSYYDKNVSRHCQSAQGVKGMGSRVGIHPLVENHRLEVWWKSS